VTTPLPPDEIAPHIARRVREVTVRNTGKQVEKALAYSKNRLKAGKPNELVEKFITATFGALNDRHMALMRGIMKHPRYKSKTVGLIGTWNSHRNLGGEEFLYAEYRVTSKKGDPNLHMEIRVSDHVIERVAERLGTINPVEIRTELATAVNSLFLLSTQESVPVAGQELKIITRHGVAIAVWNLPRVTTYTQAPVTVKTWVPFDGLNPGSHLMSDTWDEYEEPPVSLTKMKWVGDTPSLPLPINKRGNTK
jgi:hypothetical protein